MWGTDRESINRAKNMRSKKGIKTRIRKICSICGKGLRLILYGDKTYRGGHYFGKIKGKAEYWECPKCYWGK